MVSLCEAYTHSLNVLIFISIGVGFESQRVQIVQIENKKSLIVLKLELYQQHGCGYG